ncbi:MAG TPA: hypothetical protein VG052_00670 [Puia sp.]|jgi:hypothetical protein|nr:hypothetical protein [Puia sp.]
MNITFPLEACQLSDLIRETVVQSKEYHLDKTLCGPDHFRIYFPSKGLFFDCHLTSAGIGTTTGIGATAGIGTTVQIIVDSAICIVNQEGQSCWMQLFADRLRKVVAEKSLAVVGD